MLRILSIAAFLALMPAASPARAETPFLVTGRTAEAPRGFVEMCRTERTFCGPSTDRGSERLTTAAIAAHDEAPVSPPLAAGGGPEQARLAEVNRFVNGRVAQRSDRRVYGQDEYWHRSGTGRGAAGDCEDIAIEKRLQLIDRGFPADHLYFAVVYLARVGLHAVLVARTAQGDMVLDSRTPYVTRWDRTPYTWVSIQSVGDPMHWQAPESRRAQAMQVASLAD